MSRTVILLAAGALALTSAAARADAPTPLDTLVAAERGFAARSAEAGMRQAFLLNLATDAIIFRPGPTPGVPVWESRPESKYRLLWEPSWAEIAGNADLGVTTGPWVLKPGDRDTVVGQGHFITVWRRKPGAAWLVALDTGIEHDPIPHDAYGDVTFEPGETHKPVIITSSYPAAGVGLGVGLGSGSFGFGLGTVMSPQERRDRIHAHELNAMMNADRTYLYDRRGKGPAEALSHVAAPDLRMYRSERAPARGSMQSIELLKALPPATTQLPFGGDIASSYDMGYAYGLLLARAKGASRADTSAYVHVFRRDTDGKWKLIFDVETAYPKR